MARKHSSGAGSKKYKKLSFDEIDDELTSTELKSTNHFFQITVPFKHNIKQKAILEKMQDANSKITIVDGNWGSSKTYLAVLSALTLLQQGVVDKIFYIRTPCESTNTAKVGWLPGSLDEKMQLFNEVLFEKLHEFLSPSSAKKLLHDKTVESLPTSFLRGRNLNRAVLIADEASNFSWEDILLICSRLGEQSKMFMIGDSFQNDIGNKSGFKKFFTVMNDEESQQNGIFCFEMKSKEDIVRSGIIRYIMEKTGVLNLRT